MSSRSSDLLPCFFNFLVLPEKIKNREMRSLRNIVSNLLSCFRTSVLHFLYIKLYIRPKKKKCYVALTRPKFKNWVGRSGFLFFYFLRTVRELSFPIFFLKFLNGENLGGMQSKCIYKSCKCFFKPLNTNLANSSPKSDIKKKKKKKKNDPVFSHFTVGRERGNITIFFFWPIKGQLMTIQGG